jgi:hypothetical protein
MNDLSLTRPQPTTQWDFTAKLEGLGSGATTNLRI